MLSTPVILVVVLCLPTAQAAPQDAGAPAATQPAEQPPATVTPPPSTDSDAEIARDPTVGLLTPIEGGLPPIYHKLTEMSAEELRYRAKARKYAQQIRLIRHRHFGQIRAAEIRAAGTAQIREFTDPAAFRPLIDELERERDDVRLPLLDHFAEQGDHGQAALAWLAMFDKDAAIRHEALRRLRAPAADPVLYLVDGALRSRDHKTANAAAELVNALQIFQAIPLLIFAQAQADPPEGRTGDLAWIAIQTQQAYVASVQPVVGDGAAAFAPVVGIVSDGVVMRVVDAVVISYRTEVHNTLVNLTTNDWGQPTEYLAYNIQAWWDWYNDVYVPFKNEQILQAQLSGKG